MKKLLFTLSAVLLAFTFNACSDDDEDVTITKGDLPTVAQTFLDTHFAGQEITLIQKDNDSYDIYLKNGFEIDFTLSGDWDDIDGKTQSVPQSIVKLIPEAIPEYIAGQYAESYITEINKEPYGYEIELNGDLELKFDSEGKFIGIDQ